MITTGNWEFTQKILHLFPKVEVRLFAFKLYFALLYSSLVCLQPLRRPFQVKRADAALKEHTNYGKGNVSEF
jgi:hypothetical protein